MDDEYNLHDSAFVCPTWPRQPRKCDQTETDTSRAPEGALPDWYVSDYTANPDWYVSDYTANPDWYVPDYTANPDWYVSDYTANPE